MSDQQYRVYTNGSLRVSVVTVGKPDSVKETYYTFWAESYHDARKQATDHGLYGEQPLRIERPFDGTKQEWRQ